MIQPEFKSLIEILSGKLFCIPEYQRHYSWQTKQRQDLFGDIRKLRNSQKDSHFMATIVCLDKQVSQSSKAKKFNTYDIVDGQQRLTTLVILLKSISLKLHNDSLKLHNDNEVEEANDLVEEAKDLDKLLVKDSNDKRLIILQNNHDNKSLLKEFLELKDPKKVDNFYQNAHKQLETAADKNLYDAMKECRKFVDEESNTVDLLNLLQNNLCFVLLSLQDENAVYTIFEVLNSRGLAVDWLDKCKSILMGLLYEETAHDQDLFDTHLKGLQGNWSDIYKKIGYDDDIVGHEIIRFTATLMDVKGSFSKVMNAEDALKFIKESCEKDDKSATYSIEKILNVTERLKTVTSCLSELHKNKRFRAVEEISQARLLAVSIMSSNLEPKNKERLLDQWERTSFKIYGLFRKDSRTKVGDYVRVAKEIQEKSHLNQNIDELVKLIADIARDKETGNIEFDIHSSVIEEEMKKDCYKGWEEKLRYFFFRYEEYLFKNNGFNINDVAWNDIWSSSLSKTIEHVLPQNKSAEGWGHFATDEHNKYIHSIGNLCLLPQHLNLKASDNSFKSKKDIYSEADILALKAICFVDGGKEERQEWNKEAIENRTEQLIKFAKERWKDL